MHYQRGCGCVYPKNADNPRMRMRISDTSLGRHILLKSWLKVRTVKGIAREVTMLLLGMSNVRKRQLLTVFFSLYYTLSYLTVALLVCYLSGSKLYCSHFSHLLSIHKVGPMHCQLILPHETSPPDMVLVKFLFFHTFNELF